MATDTDAYLVPSFPLPQRAERALWHAASLLLFRWTPRPWHAWRAALLQLFGARMGAHCHVYPGARIWAPWNLECADTVAIADGAVIYNVARVRLGSHCVVSQDAYLCTATHDIDDAGFALRHAPITLGARAWVCARAIVGPGVTLGDGAVLGLGSVAMRDLEAWSVHAGNPARPIRTRRRQHGT